MEEVIKWKSILNSFIDCVKHDCPSTHGFFIFWGHICDKLILLALSDDRVSYLYFYYYVTKATYSSDQDV